MTRKRDEQGRFVTEPKDAPQIIQAQAPVSGPTVPAMLYGLPLTLSPGTSDILAAFHIMFEMMKELLVTGGRQGSGPGEQVVIPEGYGEEDQGSPDEFDLRSIMSLSPLARAERLRMWGLAMETKEKEADPTAAKVKEILKQAGIATKPGPGGSYAPGTVVEGGGEGY